MSCVVELLLTQVGAADASRRTSISHWEVALVLPTPVLALLMTAAAMSAGEPKHVNIAPQSVLRTPDAIAPAVLPYLACLYDRRGLPLLKATLGSDIEYDPTDKDCGATRQRSTMAALALLQQRRASNGVDPHVYVEMVLADVDAYVASLPASLAKRSHTSEREISVVVEDEVEPAYDRYRDCLTTQLSYTTVSADTVMAAFERVLRICRSMRDAAVIEAQNALMKKGWDGPTRLKTAEQTFSAADAQWLSIGRQYRESLTGTKGAGRQ